MTKRLLIIGFSLLAGFSLHAATVLWDETTNGTLNDLPYYPTNDTYVIHSVGATADGINLVLGQVTITPYPGYPTIFEDTEDAFFFTIPPNTEFTGLLLNFTPDLPCNTFGGLCASSNGIYYGDQSLGTWVATNLSPATNDIFAYLGLSAQPSGDYSMDICPLLEDYNWPTNGTVTYTLSILTSPAPPTLQISQSANQLVLSWFTNNAANFSLQSATNLNPGATWTAVTNLPTLVSNQMVLTNPSPPASSFFRLITPAP